ncbi:uncharacterized protein LOC129900939 [Solanum dulcamara]|uniref:uncharacterized protein LOC129900939 n=1 Tax=Solanum dulcamara TaxID=45834 RepID=UPI002484EABB|nr:uncharacterized protein LOC129900939 [Solanum dulcamara]
MDQEYKAITPINIVKPMVKIQEGSSGEENGVLGLTTTSQIEAILESNQHQVQTQEVAGEENGLLRLTAPFSQVQEFVRPENNVTEIFDTGDILLDKNQTKYQPTPQEETETLCETEESSLVVDLAEALLDHAPIKDRLDTIRASKSTLMLDQQSWQSKVHLQDMLL